MHIKYKMQLFIDFTIGHKDTTPANQTKCNYHDIFGVIVTKHNIGRILFYVPLTKRTLFVGLLGNVWRLLKLQLHCVFTEGQLGSPNIYFGCDCMCVSVCACVCVSVYQPQACPRHCYSLVQARITKFGPYMQRTLAKFRYALGNDWPSTSRWIWT